MEVGNWFSFVVVLLWEHSEKLAEELLAFGVGIVFGRFVYRVRAVRVAGVGGG